jgi:hypothetical protein
MICRSTSTISRQVSRTPIALVKVEGKNTACVVEALKRRIQSFPEGENAFCHKG